MNESWTESVRQQLNDQGNNKTITYEWAELNRLDYLNIYICSNALFWKICWTTKMNNWRFIFHVCTFNNDLDDFTSQWFNGLMSCNPISNEIKTDVFLCVMRQKNDLYALFFLKHIVNVIVNSYDFIWAQSFFHKSGFLCQSFTQAVRGWCNNF